MRLCFLRQLAGVLLTGQIFLCRAEYGEQIDVAGAHLVTQAALDAVGESIDLRSFEIRSATHPPQLLRQKVFGAHTLATVAANARCAGRCGARWWASFAGWWFTAYTNEIYAINWTGCQTEFTTRAAIFNDGMQPLRGADDGVHRTGGYAEKTADTTTFVNSRF